MAVVGSLGKILFLVTEKQIQTIRDATWSGSARLYTHERHLKKSLVEFCGTDPDEFRFDIRFSKYLGAAPETSIGQLLEYERSGTAIPLVLGTTKYGEYRWLVEKHKVKMEHYDRRGNMTTADVTVTLIEYIKG